MGGLSAGLRARPAWLIRQKLRSFGSRTSAALVLVLISVGVGFAIPLINPMLLVGGVLGLGFVVAILARPFWGLVAYTATYMLRPGELIPAIDPLHVERLVGLLALGSLFLAQLLVDGRIRIDKSKQSRLMLFLILTVAVSVPTSFWIPQAVGGLIDFLKIGVFYILVVHLVDRRSRLRIFLWIYCGSIVYDAIQSVFDYFHGDILHAQGIDRAIGRTGGVGANELGATMAATIPLFLLWAMRKGSGRWRLLYAAIFVLLLMTLALTGSRSALLGFLASMGYVWWHSKNKLAFGVLAIMLLGLGVAALPEQYKGRYDTIITSAESTENLDDSSKLRLIIWGAGLRMMAARPLTGVGIHCYGIANGMEFSPPGHRNWMEAHSLYIQVPAEIGFLGALAFFLFVAELLRSNRRLARRLVEEEEDWSFEEVLLNGIFAAILALLVSGVFGHSLDRRTWYLYAGLVVAVNRIYTTYRIRKQTGRSPLPG